jgi:hypothetical protein
VSKETYQCQKRPISVSKETYISVKRDLYQCQKRPISAYNTIDGTAIYVYVYTWEKTNEQVDFKRIYVFF